MPCQTPAHPTAVSPEKGRACKIRFCSSQQLYAFAFQGGSERLRVQTTVKAAGGSQVDAQRIAARCLEKCQEGWPKERVLEFRNALYQEVIKCMAAGKSETPTSGDEKPKSNGLHWQRQQQQQQEQQQQSGEHDKEDGRQINGKDLKGAAPSTDLMVAGVASSAAASARETVDSNTGGAAPEQESPEQKSPAGGSRPCRKRSIIPEDEAQYLAEHGQPLITEDAPSNSAAFEAVRWSSQNRAWVFEFQRKEGTETIRMQATVPAAGGSRENAARIARLCYAQIEAGASREEALQLRAELYKRCGPPVVKQRPGPCETFRNLFGETVSINPAAKCVAGPGPKPWQELEQSDLDRFNGDEIYHYEKELGLGLKRSLEERIVRIEQMAQKTTVQHLVKPAGGRRGNLGLQSSTYESGNGLADIAAYLDSAESEQEFEARFLQAFLAVPAEERQHTTAAEVGTLERIARIPDGAFLSVAERRIRLKENLWASRSSPSSSRETFFLKSWLTSQEA